MAVFGKDDEVAVYDSAGNRTVLAVASYLPGRRPPHPASSEVRRGQAVSEVQQVAGEVGGVNDEDIVRPRIIEMTVKPESGQQWDKAQFEVPYGDKNRPYGYGDQWRLIELGEALLRARASGAPDWSKVYLGASQTVTVQVPRGAELPPTSYELERRYKEWKEAEADKQAAERDKLRRAVLIGAGAAVGGPPVLIGLFAGLVALYEGLLKLF